MICLFVTVEKITLSVSPASRSFFLLLILCIRVPYALGGSDCRIENVIVLGKIPSSLSLALNRVFTLRETPDCFLFHMDEFRKIALTHRPFFGNEYPQPLRGSDGPVLNCDIVFLT